MLMSTRSTQGLRVGMTCLCPICACTTPVLLDKRFSAPLLQNRVWFDRVSARAAPVGELDFVLCAACGFAWNRAFRPDWVIYDQAYDPDQMGSPRFRAHVAAKCHRVYRHPPYLTAVAMHFFGQPKRRQTITIRRSGSCLRIIAGEVLSGLCTVI